MLLTFLKILLEQNQLYDIVSPIAVVRNDVEVLGNSPSH